MAHGLGFSSGLHAYPSWAPHLVAKVFSDRPHIVPECPLLTCPAGAAALTVIAVAFEVQSEPFVKQACRLHVPGTLSHLD